MKTKKILAAILSIVMVFGLMQITTNASDVPVEITPDYSWYGDGTAEEFAIATVEQLAGLAKLTQGNVVVDETTLTKTDFAGKTVKLTESITFADNQYWYYNDGTKTYDYTIKDFAGTFDGNEKTITDLKINNTVNSKSGLGLFSKITGSISNLKLDSVTGHFADGNSFGLLVANLTGTATNCHVNNVTMTSARRVASSGMMFGSVTGSASVTGCTVTGVIGTWSGNDNTDQVGALIGVAYGSKDATTGKEIRVTVSDCSVSDINFSFTRKTKRCGAFIGKADYTDITDCNASDITITRANYSQELGGFVGYAGSGSVYDNCNVTGFKYVCDSDAIQYAGCNGGFVGLSAGSDIRFVNCTATELDWNVNLSVDYGVAIGGFAGQLNCVADIVGCSASGSIEAIGGRDGDIPIGGFIGESYKTINVSECTADVDVTTTGPAGGFIGACQGGESNFTDCEALGDVQSIENAAGGFVGVIKSGTFTNCDTNGNVSGDIAGGFVGDIVPNTANIDITIDTCEANGAVTGETVASGFVGQMTTSKEDDTNVTTVAITNSTAAADIQSENGEVIAFAKETISSGSNSHYVPSGNVIKFDKEVTLSADDSVVGNNVFVSVNIEGEGSFNASELVVSYPDSLTYNESASTLNDATVAAEDGVLKLVDYGVAQNYGDDVYVLAFDAVKGGTANVSLTSAGFGTAVSSETDDLAKADCENVAAVVTVKNNVTLDEIFEGANTVMNGSDYTFSMESATGEQYNYELPTATIDGTPVDVVANADGTWTVENVTGELVITGTRTPKTHNVVINGDTAANGGETATYGTDYTFTLADDLAASTLPGYVYAVESITIDGVEYTSYTVADRVYTIAGADITGDIEITISKTDLEPNQFYVTVTGDGAGATTLSANVVDKNGSVTLTLAPEAGWSYTVTAGDYEVVQEGNVYTVSDITTTVEFTVAREVIVSSAYAAEYVTLDGTEMWLVKIGTEQIEGKVYTYNDQKMFWSEQYNAYATLVVSETKPVIESANFSIVTGDARVLAANNKDVNMTGTVDANDAQLVWNIYNATYSNFTDTVTVEKFLRADVNGDETVTVEDATAIVNHILNK